MTSETEKARVFSDALMGMVAYSRPDIILIACNTLSVVYPLTAFADTTAIPVIGIVDIGIDMMHEELSADASACGIVFGTETTIRAGSHRAGLIARGLDGREIVGQACGDLAGEIQVDPASDLVGSLIEMLADEAVDRLPNDGCGLLVAGLCCTHYGYSSALFKTALQNLGGEEFGAIKIVNPNDGMVALFSLPALRGRYGSTDLDVSVASRAPLSPGETTAIARLIEPTGPITARALRTYDHRGDLFRFTPGTR